MQWIILYVKSIRIASCKLTDYNRNLVKNHFGGSLIQKDELGGHEHYNVTRAPNKKELKGKEFEK